MQHNAVSQITTRSDQPCRTSLTRDAGPEAPTFLKCRKSPTCCRIISEGEHRRPPGGSGHTSTHNGVGCPLRFMTRSSRPKLRSDALPPTADSYSRFPSGQSPFTCCICTSTGAATGCGFAWGSDCGARQKSMYDTWCTQETVQFGAQPFSSRKKCLMCPSL